MSVILYPLRYLFLTTEDGTPLLLRDWWAVLGLAALATLPFVFTGASYFGTDGFLDKFGSFAGVLTGFYIAGLVGVASFTSAVGDLDETIESGRVLRRDSDGTKEPLTRRQYVSSLFGYLSFLSLAISVAAIFMVVGQEARPWPSIDQGTRFVLRSIIIGCINIVLAHMVVTTFHGFYYLIDRLYEKKAVSLEKRDQ